jgi:hypothetical protein
MAATSPSPLADCRAAAPISPCADRDQPRGEASWALLPVAAEEQA